MNSIIATDVLPKKSGYCTLDFLMESNFAKFVNHRLLRDQDAQVNCMEFSRQVERVDEQLAPEAAAFEYLSAGEVGSDSLITHYLDGLMLRRGPSTDTALRIGEYLLVHAIKLAWQYGGDDENTLRHQSHRLQVWLRHINGLYISNEFRGAVKGLASAWNRQYPQVPISISDQAGDD